MNEFSRYYVLIDGEPAPCSDLAMWLQYYSSLDRRVARTNIRSVLISTVFLGIDHNFFGEGPPILFETMVFGGAYDGYQERYCTRAEALAGHERVVEMVRPWFRGLLKRSLRLVKGGQR